MKEDAQQGYSHFHEDRQTKSSLDVAASRVDAIAKTSEKFKRHEKSDTNWNAYVNAQYEAPHFFLSQAANEAASSSDDPFAHTRRQTVADRENDYVKQYRQERSVPLLSAKTSYKEARAALLAEREKRSIEAQMEKYVKDTPLESSTLSGMATTNGNDQENYGQSGLLYEDGDATYLVWRPESLPDLSLPTSRWRLYQRPMRIRPKLVTRDDVFVHHLAQRSWFLFGRDASAVTFVLKNEHASKQHAIVCFRRHASRGVLPYLMDLRSTNGTFLNQEKLSPFRYVELRHRDVITFAPSQGALYQYIMMDESKVA